MATRSEKDQAINVLVEEIKATSVLYLADTTSMDAEATSNLRIKNFRKKDTKPALKSAWIDEAVFIGDDQLVMLSDLKGKEELIGDIIALLQSPMKNVISGLQGSGAHKIAGLVKTLQERAA